VTTKTIIINVRDRCGHEQNMAEYSSGNEFGQLDVAWAGDIGGRGYDGAAGGVNLKGKAWLCLACTKAFQGFMKGGQP
jgi:hypothetical protein